jgi:predicted RNase H-like HicB family nuclease
MVYRVKFEREKDGRWMAEVAELPGALVYAETRADALARVQALALRVIADELEHGELPTAPLELSFSTLEPPA